MELHHSGLVISYFAFIKDPLIVESSFFVNSFADKEFSSCLIVVENEQGVAKKILDGVINFNRAPWQQISDGAKDLVNGMLRIDPKKRLTIQQVLGKLKSFIPVFDFSQIMMIFAIILHMVLRILPSLPNDFLKSLFFQITHGCKMQRRLQMVAI